MRYFALLLSIMVCLVSVAWASEKTFDAGKDTYVDETASGANNGDAPIIIVEAMWEEELLYPINGLIWFDLGEITTPATSVFEAILRLNVTELQAGPSELEVFRAAEDWEEMEVTWDTRPAENRDLSVVKMPPEEGLFETDVTDIVQSWVSEDFPNYGFYIDAPDMGRSVCLCFASREHPDAGLQPELYVDYFLDACEEEPEDAASLQVSPVSSGSFEIGFSLATPGPVDLRIYDASGRLVETLLEGSLISGDRIVTWNGAESGVYFVRLQTPGLTRVQKVVLIR